MQTEQGILKMSKIVIMESLGISAEELAMRKKPFEEKGHTFVDFPRTTDIPTLISQAKDADAMIIANMPMPGEVIRACDNLKFIDVAFTGVAHVGLDRNISAVEARCRAGETKDGLVGSELKGKTVGIIGLGKIGSRSAELFHAFGCRVLAQSRTRKANAADYIEQVSQEELLKQSDIVVLHCPLNDSTRGMINADKIALMKKSAILINVARGPVVVARDLADALNNGTIAAAGVDVFDKEPPLDLDEPLLGCRNCLVTPHVAFASRESMSLRAEIVFDNLDAWMNGSQKNVIL